VARSPSARRLSERFFADGVSEELGIDVIDVMAFGYRGADLDPLIFAILVARWRGLLATLRALMSRPRPFTVPRAAVDEPAPRPLLDLLAPRLPNAPSFGAFREMPLT
jgi:hypothetical protein